MLASQGLVFTLNLAEEAIRFIVNTGSEEKLIGLACGKSIAKAQCPEAIN